jgi:hypothetical protein
VPLRVQRDSESFLSLRRAYSTFAASNKKAAGGYPVAQDRYYFDLNATSMS